MDTRTSYDEDIHLLDYWRVIQRRWRIVATVAVFVFVVGAAYTLTRTPLYLGAATVLVEESKSQLSLMEDLSQFGAGSIPVETEMEIIKSRSIAEHVVRRLGLDTVPERYETGKRVVVTDYRSERFPAESEPTFLAALTEGARYQLFTAGGELLGGGEVGKPFTGTGITLTAAFPGYRPGERIVFRKVPFQAAVAELQTRMDVRELGKKTNIIRISVNLPEPYLARDTADEITEAYVSMNIARKSQEASQMLEFIEQQLETIRTNLEKGEQELDQLKTDKGFFVLSESAQKLINQISQLEISRATITLQQRQVTRLLENLKSAGDKDAPYLLGEVSLPDPLATRLIGELSEKLVELRGLRQDLTDDNPRVTFTLAQIDELKTKVRTAVANAKGSLDNQLTTINKIIGGYEEQLKSLPKAERELAALTRKSEVNADLYTFLLKKHEEARISRAGIVGNARVIDPALLSSTPVEPRKKRNLALSLLAGLLLGILGAFFVDYLDDSVRSLEVVEQELQLHAFGVIPFVEVPENERLLIDRFDPRSPIQEAFRSFRTNLQFAATTTPAKMLLCTSATPGAGKTTTNANLAVSLAQGGAKVLLVDCDLRRPQLHRTFGVPIEPGLTNALLTGEDWRNLAQVPEGMPNLTVLTAGTLPPNPADFLASERLRSFLAAVREEFDYVIIDIPPTLAFSDAAIVAAYADAIFLVIEAGRSRLPLLKRALDVLATVNAKVRGGVLNKVPASDHGGHYEYYAYGYQDYQAQPGPAGGLWAKVKLWFL